MRRCSRVNNGASWREKSSKRLFGLPEPEPDVEEASKCRKEAESSARDGSAGMSASRMRRTERMRLR